MTVGILTIEILIDEAFSLKDKRSVLKRVKKRLRDNFNIAIAEIDYQELWNKSKLAMATISSDSKNVDRVMQNILTYLEDDRSVEILRYSLEKF